MFRKVLFLDHDGVMVPFSSNVLAFSPVCVNNLNMILEHHPDLEIVVSSDWKHRYSKETLGLLYRDWGVKKQPVGVTSNLTTPNPEKTRENEIKLFIQENNVKKYVILDDLCLEGFGELFFKCSPYIGLTREIAFEVSDIVRLYCK